MATVLKSEPDGKHPSSHYLVVEDESKPTTWHLRYKDVQGNVDHNLMGNCWAALHSGFRGNTYQGPNKAEALRKLTALYRSENIDTPKAFREPAIEYKTLPFSMDADDEPEERQFSGYVAAFNSVDSAGDVILPGAFKDSISSFLSDGAICWQHDWKEPIGKPLEAREDSRGLFIKAKVSDTTRGRDALTLMRDGVVSKLSIGYKATKSRHLSDDEGKSLLGDDAYTKAMDDLPWDRAGIRALESIKLFEGSPVTVPANFDAIITSVKAGLPAGLMLDEQVEYTLAVNDDLIERYGNVRELRMKAGRVLSSTNHAKLRDVHDRLMAQLQALDDLLDSMLPADAGEQDGKAAEQAAELKSLAITEMARFQRTLARMNGAA